MPILQVILRDPKRPEAPRTFRFMLSTTSWKTVLDKRIPSDFTWEDPGQGGGDGQTATPVLIKRIEVAGLARENLPAVGVDLTQMGNACLDNPVDGVLGMNFLLGTRFLFDVKGGRILWWGPPFQGAFLPFLYDQCHIPHVQLAVGGAQVAAVVDLTSTGGLELPGWMEPPGPSEPTYIQDRSGRFIPQRGKKVARIQAGPCTWTDVPVFFQDGTRVGNLGLDALRTEPLCFDFIQDGLILGRDSEGRLPAIQPSRPSLPVAWDRTGREPRLVVVWVKPGSPMETAGCKPGDEIVQAGDLSGPALTRRALMALMDQGRYHVWTVRRNGLTERLPMFVQDGP